MAVLIAGLVLINWTWDLASLQRLLSVGPPMMPLTAIALIATSASSWLLQKNDQRPGKVSLAVGLLLAAGITLLGVSTLFEHLFHWNLGFDRLFFADRLDALKSAAMGRPSYYTALILILLGAALLLLDTKTRRGYRPSEFLALGAWLVAAMGIEGYVIGYTPFYVSAPGRGMAPHTAIACIALATAVFLVRPGGLIQVLSGRGAGGVTARLLVPLPFVMNFVLSWIVLAFSRAGVVDRIVGTWLLNLSILAVCTMVIWLVAIQLHRADIDRQQGVQALAESEQRFRKVFEDGPLGMAMVGVDDRFLAANPALWHMASYSEDELKHTTLSALLQPEALGSETVARRLSNSELDRFELEARLVRSDQGLTWVNLTATMIRDIAGTPLYALVLLQDVSERKRHEQVLETQRSQIEAANKELEAFSYSVSHDLRAPLRAIDGFSRILVEEHAPSLQGEPLHYLKRIRAGAQTMGHLIDDLLNFSRLSKQALRKQPVVLVPLVREVLRELQSDRARSDMDVVVGELPNCLGDSALLRQAFVNLLSNALKFSRHRDPARIEIGCHLNGGPPVYFVRDNGAGFDMQYADKLFGVFQRLHRVEEFEGTGVGLAIVQRIVARHGGRIWAESRPDQGATFYFTFAGAA